jgi:hypothetical protein
MGGPRRVARCQQKSLQTFVASFGVIWGAGRMFKTSECFHVAALVLAAPAG